ncbi:MAG TPA: M24 family metallopeptidase [Bryobacteraceae bacterium]|nr:M24 family metallopeptidase [Bryobacteraceae bacterium]
MQLEAIQHALRAEKLDGWLFFDHHRRDPLAYRILGLPDALQPTRRWYYLIPAEGEPVGMVHRIELRMLDDLPGKRVSYSQWTEQQQCLADILRGLRRVAMQYSPECAVPYVSMVDAGTIELVRGSGVEIVSSADLVQLFEATWSAEQRDSHYEAGRLVDEIRRAAFQEAGRRLRGGEPVNEYAVKKFILDAFERSGLVTNHGPIVAVNANASNPHYEPEPERAAEIHAGDLLLIDLWAKLRRPAAVYYDITWTGCCATEVRSEMHNVFAIVREARDAAVERVRAATASGQVLRGFEVDDAARGHIVQHGFGDYFIHRTGHSIGSDVHGAGANMDNFESHDERRIIPRTCFSVEPGIYLPQFGIRSEVNVYVGEREASVTGEAQTALLRFGCGV